MRQLAGRRHSPAPVSSNQYTSVCETVAADSKAYSTHSSVPLRGHQWKKEFSASFEELGSIWSLIARGFLPLPETVTRLFEATVGLAGTRTLFSELASQTAIWPRPRLAHVK